MRSKSLKESGEYRMNLGDATSKEDHHYLGTTGNDEEEEEDRDSFAQHRFKANLETRRGRLSSTIASHRSL